MFADQDAMARRAVLLGLMAAAIAPVMTSPARAGVLSGGGLLDLLGTASDRALDNLSQPGAFYNDPAVRIGLPLLGGQGASRGALGSLVGVGEQLGVTDGLVRKLNDAAGAAAREAKPIFRTAIRNLSITDAPGIMGQSDGATQYLRRSATPDLTTKVRPLIDTALGQAGAFTLFDNLAKRHKFLSAAGLTRRTLGQSVTDQAIKGMFHYIGGEETKVRADPGKAAGSVLKGLIGN